MSGDSTRPGGPIAVFCAGGACALLGSVTLIGWFFDIPALSRHGLSPQAMAMNTAVGLVLDGLALLGLARGRRGAALPGALWSLLIGALTLVEYGWPANLHIDWVPVPYTLHFLSGGAGRLAPNTAAAFVLCGIALLCAWGSRLSARGTTVTGVLGAVVLAFGTTCVFGHLGGHPTYAWGPWKQMAPATGIGFIALGLGLAAVAWQYGARGAAENLEEAQEAAEQRLPGSTAPAAPVPTRGGWCRLPVAPRSPARSASPTPWKGSWAPDGRWSAESCPSRWSSWEPF